MRPLIFEFRETPNGEANDYSLIEYDHKLNLSINKITGRPAIESANLETDTFTKTQGEGSDSDKSQMAILMDTQTRTYSNNETSDDDKSRKAIESLMETSTLTESSESTDQDKPMKWCS